MSNDILREEQIETEAAVEEAVVDTALQEDGEALAEDTQNQESSDAQTEGENVKTHPYHENYYLLYGDKEKNCLDLEGTRKLLQELGYDGGELFRARKGKEAFRSYSESEGSNKMFCSYCGLEIAGVEYNRLPDGRLRCTGCSNSLVKSEIQELCDRVKANMEAFFGATINVPIQIEVLEERKLKKKIKRPLSVVADKSILILGAAVKDRKGYHICLENGAPRISVIATFAHELTHIWQHVNWGGKKGFKKCPKEKRLLIYEGMAKWAEIQYLYLVGEFAVAKREEYITRNRDDEYGIGFRMVEKNYPLSYNTVICDDSPFVKDKYPID